MSREPDATFSRRLQSRLRYYRGGRSPGTAAALFVIDCLDKLGIRLSPYAVVTEGLGNVSPPPEPCGAAYEYRFLDTTDMTQMANLSEHGVDCETLVRRLQEGSFCYGALRDCAIVSFVWCNLSVCTFSAPSLRDLKADEGYLFDAFTVESFRGRGLAPYVRYRLYRELGARGRSRFYSVTQAANAPANSFKSKLGARPLESGIRIRLMRRWGLTVRLRQYEPADGR